MDTLIPLKLPPGMRNTGTTYQSKDRWFTGNFVRFLNGAIQPIGGWAAWSTTGATIAGTPIAAHAWYLTAGTSYLAIGTTRGLYIINTATKVVTDITPSTMSSDVSTRVWQLSNFGSYLVAAPGISDPSLYSSGADWLWCWRGNTAVHAEWCDSAFHLDGTASDDPFYVNGVVVTPERFLVVIRGDDPNGTSRPANWVG